jgi:hypothetical protein
MVGMSITKRYWSASQTRGSRLWPGGKVKERMIAHRLACAGISGVQGWGGKETRSVYLRQRESFADGLPAKPPLPQKYHLQLLG